MPSRERKTEADGLAGELWYWAVRLASGLGKAELERMFPTLLGGASFVSEYDTRQWDRVEGGQLPGPEWQRMLETGYPGTRRWAKSGLLAICQARHVFGKRRNRAAFLRAVAPWIVDPEVRINLVCRLPDREAFMEWHRSHEVFQQGGSLV